MKYTWGNGWSSPVPEDREGWQVLLFDDLTERGLPFGHGTVILGGIPTEWQAHAISVILNAEEDV